MNIIRGEAGKINEEDLKEAVRDIGIDFDVVYLDESTMPKDSEGRSDGLNRTIEVKKYDIDKNSSSMISKIVEQAKERDIHLSEGNTQEVHIDIRNQNVSLEKQEFIKNKIEKDSNGIIKKENIHLKK